MKTSTESYQIKTELLEICEAFNLGALIDIVSFEKSTKLDNYIFTQFETETGRFNHYFKIK